METVIQNYILGFGIEKSLAYPLALAASILALACITAVAGFVLKLIVVQIILRVVARTNTEWDDYLLTKEFFGKLTWLIQFATSYILLWYIIPENAPTFHWLSKLILASITLTTTLTLFSFLTNITKAFQNLHGNNNVPVKSYAQVVKILLGLVAAVLIISILAEQSPVGVLSGIGAMTAVLLLVFKDSLLGFLASLQISTQNMVKIGDWIEIPAQGIDGEVMDISLNVIKIKNWDNTVTSIPTYNIVSGSFKNWRPMHEAGGRRIKRSIPLDATSIRPIDPELVTSLTGLNLLGSYLDLGAGDFGSHTNLGAFRVYAQAYLDKHPGIHKEMGRVVRQMENQGRGLPVEFIFFSTSTSGPHYEALLSEVFEHLYAILPRFGLRVFQEATGHDLRGR